MLFGKNLIFLFGKKMLTVPSEKNTNIILKVNRKFYIKSTQLFT